MLISPEQLQEIMENACDAAIRYYKLTGKPLGITGEFGEYLVAKLMQLQLTDARTPGYDAIDSRGKRIQIKTRSIPQGVRLIGQRMGQLKTAHDWDSVMLLMLNECFEPQWIYEAERAPVIEALAQPGSRARSEPGLFGSGHEWSLRARFAAARPSARLGR